MSKVCSITGKTVSTGNNVPIARSHTGVRTRRRFEPNLQNATFYSDILGIKLNMRVTPNGIRTIEKNGGLDAYVLSKPISRLSDECKALRKRIEKAQAKKGATA